MELAVECRGNVVGNLFFIRREFQQCNQFLFSALSRVFAKSILLWPPAAARGSPVFEQHTFSTVLHFSIDFQHGEAAAAAAVGPPRPNQRLKKLGVKKMTWMADNGSATHRYAARSLPAATIGLTFARAENRNTNHASFQNLSN
jgi:hypothetical protein